MRLLIVIAAAVLLLTACGSRSAKKDQAVVPESIAEGNTTSDLSKMPHGTKPYEERTKDGKLRARGFLCDGKPIGAWSYAYDNGQKRCQGTYLYGGIRSGEWTYWWPNGRAHSTGDFVQGHEQGEWKYWHDNGTTAAQGSFSRGTRVGAWRSWHENGVAESDGAYIDGANAADDVLGRWRGVGRRGMGLHDQFLTEDRAFARGFDAQANLSATDLEDGDDDVASDDDLFIDATSEYQHARV